MDSQMNGELLNEMLEGDIISLSGGESDSDLLGPDFGRDPKEDLNTRRYSIIDELMDGPPTHRTIHSNTRETTKPTHTQITTTTTNKPLSLSPTHILKTLRQNTTVTTPSTSTSPPLPKTSPSPTVPHQPSTATRKPITTSSNQTMSPSKHLLFTFYFIHNHPKFISKLNRPKNLAKLCTEIQRNAELSIIKLVENYLSKQHKQKKRNKNKSKNNISNTTSINYKPRFTSKEHKPTSPILTSPFHISPPTYTTTAIQTTPPGFDQHTPTTTTQYTQPPQKSHVFTTTTQYMQPTPKKIHFHLQ